MKKQIHILIFVTMLMGSTAFAQYKTAPDGITAKRVLMDFYSPVNDFKPLSSYDDLKALGGAEIGYTRHLSKCLNLALPLRIGVADMPKQGGGYTSRVLNTGLDAVLQLKYFQPKKLFNPYLMAGIGGVMENWKDTRVDIPLGIGFNLRLAPLVYVNLQTEYRMSLTDNRDNLQHSLGFLFLIGNEMNDRDKDGIADEVDQCPDEFGLAQFNGCPDKDGDGIPDKTDLCPDEAGIAALNGCPDKDGDGVADKDDACADVPGLAAFKGCPDTDGDGVMDSEDECPTVKGLAAFKGCPDTDGDGIADKDDKCPTVAGPRSNNGCPEVDTDKDGVPDKTDKCPTAAGPASNQGCPEMKKEEKVILENAARAIQFDLGKATIKKTSYVILDQVVGLMNMYPSYSCDISGHTDKTGSATLNQSLSEKRAKACYDYLVSKGIVASRLSNAGFGDTKPVGDNKTAAGRALNRRTEFLMTVK